MLLFSRNTLTGIRHTETHLSVIFQSIGKSNRSLDRKFQGIRYEIREYLHDSVLVGINHYLWRAFVKTQYNRFLMFFV